jgi:twitching motility two-component system response regulator PilG
VPDGAPRRVLIVEDAKTITLLLQIYLMGWGLEFLEAGNGQEGLEVARRERPDLVVSDVQMPLLDGFGLCAAIRRDPVLCATPFVLLTGLKDAAARARGTAAGASAFLHKPIVVDDLRATVQRLLDLPHVP